MTDPREWLEADGLGGFAMGTADGIRTRRYHAYLLTATHPPEGRMVLVADLEVNVDTAAGRFALCSHRYGDVIHPDGATRLTRFTWQPHPRWEWTLPDGTRIAGELVVAPGTPRTAMRWTRLAGTGPATLIVQPLIACRDYHSTHHENDACRFTPVRDGDAVVYHPYDGNPEIVVHANATYHHAPDWYRAFRLTAEAERGLDAVEDLMSPGAFHFDLAAAPAAMTLSTSRNTQPTVQLVDQIFSVEAARRSALAPLTRAAESYIAARGAGLTIMAGYPWFADWGRDTFISLRGLCLATGHREVAQQILLGWSTAVDGGMLPNRFDESDANPEFNSVDAALWFVIAADAYLAGATSAADRVALESAIDKIVAGYAAGTRHNIHADTDGLIACGEPGVQLTWMDAKVNGEVITPRIGKPVEIQALWINALVIAGRRAAQWRNLAELARSSFAARFWDAEHDQLYDVVDCDHVAGTADATCRPNQLFAIGSLPLAVVEGERARAIVDTCERELWTPSGPRSLAPGDARYVPHYGGGPLERDRAYHNGTVWPWLAGVFVEAWVRVRGNTAEAKRTARARFLAPLLARLELAGLGHLSEICDADPPHRPVGCPFQAWSVAEALRLDLDVLRV